VSSSAHRSGNAGHFRGSAHRARTPATSAAARTKRERQPREQQRAPIWERRPLPRQRAPSENARLAGASARGERQCRPPQRDCAQRDKATCVSGGRGKQEQSTRLCRTRRELSPLPIAGAPLTRRGSHEAVWPPLPCSQKGWRGHMSALPQDISDKRPTGASKPAQPVPFVVKDLSVAAQRDPREIGGPLSTHFRTTTSLL